MLSKVSNSLKSMKLSRFNYLGVRSVSLFGFIEFIQLLKNYLFVIKFIPCYFFFIFFFMKLCYSDEINKINSFSFFI